MSDTGRMGTPRFKYALVSIDIHEAEEKRKSETMAREGELNVDILSILLFII